ncbi:hypothetical protein HMPREF9069_00631, partial [Atopobium sp. oral taxon 810 str. F0209]
MAKQDECDSCAHVCSVGVPAEVEAAVVCLVQALSEPVMFHLMQTVQKRTKRLK